MLTDEIEYYVAPAGVKCVAADQLPQGKLKKPALFVCNTEEISKNGAHWVLTGKPSENELIFFDALCLPPLVRYYYHFLNRNKAGTTFKLNRYPIQSETSFLCGPYCVMLVWHLRTGHSFESFCAQFGASVVENDLKLQQQWKKFTRWFAGRQQWNSTTKGILR
jgi:hypothetical protein